MKRFALIAALAATLPAALPAVAATADGRAAMKEAGLASCDQFVQEREKQSPAHLQFVGWVAGYLSAYNQFAPDTFDVAPWASMPLIDAVLADVCNQNRDKPFAGAVNFIVNQLAATKLSEPSDLVEAKAGDKSVRLYKEVLKRAQARLQEKGLYKGTPDGAFGDGTRKGFEAFQKQANMPVSGLPDPVTLARLFSQDAPPAKP